MATGLFNLKQVNQAISQGAWSGYIAPRWVEYLVVAGGGGSYVGGGGAGGLLTGIVTVAAGASYSVTVGSGGSFSGTPTSGQNSVFGNITALGGGAASSASTSTSGGSGGGGSYTAVTTGGQGTSGQGNAGGTNTSGTTNAAGGGGAGTVGLNSTSSTCGNGGAGIASAITGTVVTYAGGGGGSGSGTAGAGGVGGGGTGNSTANTSNNGSTNTGGGGGGSYNASGYGNGGSGIVVVRYPGNVQFYTGGTVTYSNGYIVHNFTANGTLAPTTPTVVSEYQISRSLRFNSADSAYLNRTLTTPTNANKFTLSLWVKRGKLTAPYTLFNVSNTDYIQFGPTDKISVVIGNSICINTTAVFRDPSAWYHLVFSYDSSESTKWNCYVNSVNNGTGTLGSATFNTAVAHYIGNVVSGGNYFDGYMTEINFIDGQALTPTSFGYVSPTTGIWSPAKYVGGYGTNGFYLNFSDNSNTTAATLGADYSGNGNNWTPNNFSVTAGAGNDSLVDSPTSYGTDTGVGGTVRGNYATWNPLAVAVTSGISTLSNGNLDVVTAVSGQSATFATISLPSSGKWYWEITPTNVAGGFYIGIAVFAVDANYFFNGTSLFYGNDGTKEIDATSSSYGASFTTGDVIGVAVDVDGGTVTFYKNNSSQGAITYSGATLTPFILDGSSSGSSSCTGNFGQRAFAYTAPSGFKALCTQNLPTPTIGATTATLATQYFGAATYTGNGTSQSLTLGFQPDFTWIKARNMTYSNLLTNAVTGGSNYLVSNSTAAEAGGQSLVTAWTSTGVTLGSWVASNESTLTYVAWNWRASNTTAVTNTAGSITSTVSANTTSGFSVVTYTGNSTNSTVGHGLGVAPSMIIIKRRDGADIWPVYHQSIGNTQYLRLQGDNPAGSFNLWQSTSPTSTVFSLATDSTVNQSTWTYVAYCFAPVAGYSAFGSYTGNGSSDGPFVFTGMRPAFILIKNTSSTGYWVIFDVARNTYNAMTSQLWPNGNDAESNTYGVIDAVSNGFKLRNTAAGYNDNGATYIYMALASNPFKYSLAR